MGEMKITGNSRGSRRSWRNSLRMMDRMAFMPRPAVVRRRRAALGPTPTAAGRAGSRASATAKAASSRTWSQKAARPGPLEDDGPQGDQEVAGRDEVGHGLDDGGHVPDREDEARTG
ncbi:MAG: hypothetical protein MZV63_72485 [Marinilabiliales bacterium]|nr:hypothetical protein [Marinilabiliales bacterium]